MEGMKNCLIGLSCISVDDRAREIELSRRMMKARNKQIDKGKIQDYVFSHSFLFILITLISIEYVEYLLQKLEFS